MTTSPVADGSPQPDQERGPWPAVAAVVAFLLLAPVGFFYAASGLLVPGPWLFLLWVLFVVLVVVAVLLARRAVVLGAGRAGARRRVLVGLRQLPARPGSAGPG